MASGTISLGTSNQIQGQIVWSSTSNGTAANTSKVTATIQVRRTNSYTTSGHWKGALNIGGTSKSFNIYKQVTNAWVTLLSFSETIAHAASGVGTCYISGQINGPGETTQANSVVYDNATVTLDTIPRYASITSAPNFTDEGNPTIQYTNPAGSSVTKLEACISLDGSADDIAYREISKTDTSYTFNLTDAERAVLRNATLSGSTVRTVRFYVKTTIGSNTNLNDVTRNLTIINCAPTLSLETIDLNNMEDLTGSDAVVVRYVSDIYAGIVPITKKGASIVSSMISNAGRSSTTGTLDRIEGVSSNYFYAKVTDNRGLSAEYGVTLGPDRWVPYVKPTCVIGNNQPTAEGALSLEITGQCYDGHFDVQNTTPTVANTMTVFYRYKPVNGDYVCDWTPIASANISRPASTNRYTATQAITGLDYNTAYVVEAYISDKIMDTAVASKSVKASPVFDWSDEDFNLNVKLNMNGVTVLRMNNTDSDYGNVVLSAPTNVDTGIFIRPNGTGSAEGETIFYKDGSIETSNSIAVYGDIWLDGDISIDGTVVLRRNGDNGNVIVSAVGPQDGVFIRPNGTGDATGQTIFGKDGRITTTSILASGAVQAAELKVTGISTPVGGQTVLWSGESGSDGGLFMRDTNTITLPTAISKTLNGILLVFCQFSNGAAVMSNFNTFFVSKYEIAKNPGASRSFTMANVNFSSVCSKVLYINDSTIRGHASNAASGTGSSGITYNNTAYVLRYVIAV